AGLRRLALAGLWKARDDAPVKLELELDRRFGLQLDLDLERSRRRIQQIEQRAVADDAHVLLDRPEAGAQRRAQARIAGGVQRRIGRAERVERDGRGRSGAARDQLAIVLGLEEAQRDREPGALEDAHPPRRYVLGDVRRLAAIEEQRIRRCRE